jgi:hypothetical protein
MIGQRLTRLTGGMIGFPSFRILERVKNSRIFELDIYADIIAILFING